jgi:CSLREA domain-containing protein
MLCFSFGMVPGAQAVIVTKSADTNDGVCDADCSLREAIRVANATAGADTITFTNLAGSPDLYTLTIPGSLEDAAATGDLDITDTVTITGNGFGETRPAPPTPTASIRCSR